MKKMLIGAFTIAACVALCAAVWPRTGAGEEIRQEANASATAATVKPLVKPPAEPSEVTMLESTEPSAEKEDTAAPDTPAAELPTAPVRPAQTAPSTTADAAFLHGTAGRLKVCLRLRQLPMFLCKILVLRGSRTLVFSHG